MKFIFLTFFIGLSFFLLFKSPSLIEKKKLIIYCGVGLALTIILFVISPVIVFGLSKISTVNIHHIDKILKSLFLSFLTLFFFHLFMLLVLENLIHLIINFQKNYNSSNLERNPVKFALSNKHNIVLTIKVIFFFFGQCLPFYGIWIDANR